MQPTVSASDSPEIPAFPLFSALHDLPAPDPKWRDVVLLIHSEACDVKYNSPSCFSQNYILLVLSPCPGNSWGKLSIFTQDRGIDGSGLDTSLSSLHCR